MANNPGLKMQVNEVWSDKYQGYIHKVGNLYRMPFERIDKSGRVRQCNRYAVEVKCGGCGKIHLNDWANYRKYESAYCSAKCGSEARRRPDGHKKRKHKNEEDSYIMVKAESHPNVTNDGYVAEHRLVMENLIGRLLSMSEKVHHLNCIKSDNSPDNLILCKNNRDHHLIHGSLNKCVAQLMDLGYLRFDKKNRVYIVSV
jgi:hypothetical protein